MKKLYIFLGVVLFALTLVPAFGQDGKAKLVLLISEQNISGPQHAWWASEIDLSTIETNVAKKLIAEGYEILSPSSLGQVIKKDKAFRMVDLSEEQSIKLGNLSKADYVIQGKAIASSGGNVPQSNMISCFANVTASVISVKDGKVIAYLDAAGNSVHLDVVTGGREALAGAGSDLAQKIIEVLNRQGGK